VGQQHAEYSFEHKFRAMIGKTHSKVKDELQQDFPNLPLGCFHHIRGKTAKRKLYLETYKVLMEVVRKSILKAMKLFVQDYSIDFYYKELLPTYGN
jgi:uncharacterized protein with HEPN domain